MFIRVMVCFGLTAQGIANGVKRASLCSARAIPQYRQGFIASMAILIAAMIRCGRSPIVVLLMSRVRLASAQSANRRRGARRDLRVAASVHPLRQSASKVMVVC
jgi:hypothetical protein